MSVCCLHSLRQHGTMACRLRRLSEAALTQVAIDLACIKEALATFPATALAAARGRPPTVRPCPPCLVALDLLPVAGHRVQKVCCFLCSCGSRDLSTLAAQTVALLLLQADHRPVANGWRQGAGF